MPGYPPFFEELIFELLTTFEKYAIDNSLSFP